MIKRRAFLFCSRFNLTLFSFCPKFTISVYSTLYDVQCTSYSCDFTWVYFLLRFSYSLSIQWINILVRTQIIIVMKQVSFSLLILKCRTRYLLLLTSSWFNRCSNNNASISYLTKSEEKEPMDWKTQFTISVWVFIICLENLFNRFNILIIAESDSKRGRKRNERRERERVNRLH